MVIQKLQTIEALLKQDPPQVEAALFELEGAMQLAMQEKNWPPYRSISHDQLLKEFGW